MPELVGTVVAQRYEIAEVIGRGGQGVVCRAHDRQARRDVAIKMLTGPAARDPQLIERMRREQQAMEALAGTNAVGVLDLCTSPRGALCLVMELLDGIDLDRHLEELEDRKETFDVDRLVEVLDPIALTLERAHAAGIVHRDLKPGNIFLVSERAGGGVRLLDFGLARVRASRPLTAAGTIMGSPSYIAPEVWKGRPDLIDHRVDQYSLAVIVYRALSGCVPFGGESLQEKFALVTRAERPSLKALRSELPDAVDPWVRRALAIEPADRFSSIQTMWDALLVALDKKELAEAKRTDMPKGAITSAWRAATSAMRRLASARLPGALGPSARSSEQKKTPAPADAPGGGSAPAPVAKEQPSSPRASRSVALPRVPPPPPSSRRHQAEAPRQHEPAARPRITLDSDHARTLLRAPTRPKPPEDAASSAKTTLRIDTSPPAKREPERPSREAGAEPVEAKTTLAVGKSHPLSGDPTLPADLAADRASEGGRGLGPEEPEPGPLAALPGSAAADDKRSLVTQWLSRTATPPADANEETGDAESGREDMPDWLTKPSPASAGSGTSLPDLGELDGVDEGWEDIASSRAAPASTPPRATPTPAKLKGEPDTSTPAPPTETEQPKEAKRSTGAKPASKRARKTAGKRGQTKAKKAGKKKAAAKRAPSSAKKKATKAKPKKKATQSTARARAKNKTKKAAGAKKAAMKKKRR